jgi:hypothetical protein
MTALIVVLPLIVVVEISLQLHRSLLSLLFTYPHPPPEADEVSRDYWQLVTASHHDSDGLILHQ